MSVITNRPALAGKHMLLVTHNPMKTWDILYRKATNLQIVFVTFAPVSGRILSKVSLRDHF